MIGGKRQGSRDAELDHEGNIQESTNGAGAWRTRYPSIAVVYRHTGMVLNGAFGDIFRTGGYNYGVMEAA